jgi:hypothetical protein
MLASHGPVEQSELQSLLPAARRRATMVPQQRRRPDEDEDDDDDSDEDRAGEGDEEAKHAPDEAGAWRDNASEAGAWRDRGHDQDNNNEPEGSSVTITPFGGS